MAEIELIYTSRAKTKLPDDEVREIVESSQRNNRVNGITGLLLFDGVRFVQVLEGESKKVDTLYGTIRQDARHTDLERLHRGGIKGRSFEDWRMAYEALPPGLLGDLAESMAVYALENDENLLSAEESFGARLRGLFLQATATQ